MYLSLLIEDATESYHLNKYGPYLNDRIFSILHKFFFQSKVNCRQDSKYLSFRVKNSLLLKYSRFNICS